MTAGVKPVAAAIGMVLPIDERWRQAGLTVEWQGASERRMRQPEAHGCQGSSRFSLVGDDEIHAEAFEQRRQPLTERVAAPCHRANGAEDAGAPPHRLQQAARRRKAGIDDRDRLDGRQICSIGDQ